MPLYNVFHRTWWKSNPKWPKGLEPNLGKRTYIARKVSWEVARAIASEYNTTHKPGKLSRKAELEAI